MSVCVGCLPRAPPVASLLPGVRKGVSPLRRRLSLRHSSDLSSDLSAALSHPAGFHSSLLGPGGYRKC